MKKELLNRGWYFTSDICAEPIAVTVPHDAMQTEQRRPALKDGTQTGFYPGGTYTYEKELVLSEEDAGKTILLEFEGVYMRSSVYLNGEQVGGRIYGYSDFIVDLTGKVRAGSNTLKVVADNSRCANSRWYSGSGIYRDVWLHTAGKAYIPPYGMKITTESIAPAKLRVRTEAVGSSEVRVTAYRDGRAVASAAGTDAVLEIPDAALWSAETPVLYEVRAELLQDDAVADTASELTGIRMLAWDAEKGFTVNGNTVKLRGGCVHHDNGIIGAAEYDAACMRRVRIMKEAGFNAVRTAHNPTSNAMLRACDRLGMYVMNESFDTWYGLKSPYDYAMYFPKEWEKDLSDMVRVSFNHPSVILYSIGNEVYLKDKARAAETTEKMTALCHRLDPSRPVTNALNPMMVMLKDSEAPEAHADDRTDPRAEGDGSALTGSALANTLITFLDVLMKVVGNEKAMRKTDGAMKPLDIVGFNYGSYLYDPQHKDYPGRVLLGTETFPKKLYENWQLVTAKPWVTGDFQWTAWDYLGECGCGAVSYGKQGAFTQPFPTISAGCGSIDLSGEILPQGRFCSAVFGTAEKPWLAVHPVTHAGEKAFTGKWRLTDAVRSWDWTGCEGKTAAVDVYSSASTVELFLNGKSLGRKAPAGAVASFAVPYAAGELKAVQYDKNGDSRGSDVLTTPGSGTKLCIAPEAETVNAGCHDLMYVPIYLTDENGVRRTAADREITVSVSGAAELLALGNADTKQESLTPYIHTSVKTWGGRALAVLRSAENAGDITVTVSAEGLEPAQVTLRCI